MSILVVGSFVTDLVANTDRAPEAGESVRGNSFNIYLGGKGINQAVAAKRMGADVVMVGCIGNDSFGNDFIEMMNKEGLDTRYIKRSELLPTGCSLIVIDKSGQNRICMTPGANLDYTVEDLRKVEHLVKEADVVVTQCEMLPEIVEELACMCRRHGKRFILNPAPAGLLSDDVIASTYVISPNETELGAIVDKKAVTIEDYIEGAKALLEKGSDNVIVTLGERGSLLVNRERTEIIPSVKVKAVDTVGAGDSFTGSLSAFISEGKDILSAMRLSTRVAAIQITRRGAIPSMPYRKEIE